MSAANARIAIPGNIDLSKKRAYFESIINHVSHHMQVGNLIVENLSPLYASNKHPDEEAKFPLHLFDFFRWKGASESKLNVSFMFHSLNIVPIRLLARCKRFRYHKQVDDVSKAIDELVMADSNSNPGQRNCPIIKNEALFRIATRMLHMGCAPRDYLNINLERQKVEIIGDGYSFVLTPLTD